jgi:hypothetical protein
MLLVVYLIKQEQFRSTPPVAAPAASNQTVCSNGTCSKLAATATGGTITWYDAATAGNIVTTPTN